MLTLAGWVLCVATSLLQHGSTWEFRCSDSASRLWHAHSRCGNHIRTPRASTAPLENAREPRGTSRVAHCVLQNSLACLWLHDKLICPCRSALHCRRTCLVARCCTDPGAAFARLILRGGRETGHPSQGRARQAGPKVGRIFLAVQCKGNTAAPDAGTRLRRMPARRCWGKTHASACVCLVQRPTCHRKQAQNGAQTTQQQMKSCTSSSRQKHPLRSSNPKAPWRMHHTGAAKQRWGRPKVCILA